MGLTLPAVRDEEIGARQMQDSEREESARDHNIDYALKVTVQGRHVIYLVVEAETLAEEEAAENFGV